MAADVGSLARFPKVVGNESFTREVAFTGRDFTAAEALQVGFVSKVVEGGREGVLGTRLSLSRLLVITAMCRNRYWRKIANAGLNGWCRDGIGYCEANCVEIAYRCTGHEASVVALPGSQVGLSP